MAKTANIKNTKTNLVYKQYIVFETLTEIELFRSSHTAEKISNSRADSISRSLVAGKYGMLGSQQATNALSSGINFDKMKECIAKGFIVALSPIAGSYFVFAKDDKNYIIEEIDRPSNPYVFIKDNTTYLNLENDPVIEEYTKKMLGEIDPDFSFIVNLRSFSNDELLEIMQEFRNKSKGNAKGLWIYTTGSDREQMYDYTQAAIDAGLKEIRILLNGSSPEEFVEYLNKFKNNIEISISGA